MSERDETDRVVVVNDKNTGEVDIEQQQHHHQIHNGLNSNNIIESTNNNNNSNNNNNGIVQEKKITTKQWVQFDEDDERNKQKNNVQVNSLTSHPLAQSPHTLLHNIQEEAPAVLPTESVHINIDQKSPTTSTTTTIQSKSLTTTATQLPITTIAIQSSSSSSPAVIDIPKNPVSNSTPTLRTIELSTGLVREGFANGDVIVTLLPINTKLPWITPAEFRPELVPEELMAQGLTLTVEEYVHAMETLVNDYRFTLYNICYKRVLICWILFAFCVLLLLLFSGLMGIALFTLGVGWLFLNAAAIFFCMFIKLRLSRGLEKCLANVNKQLLKHKIILALDDRGKISCHKVNLCFIYFDPIQCIQFLNDFIERHEQSGTTIEPGWESRLDISVNDIIIQGSNTTRVSRKQERATHLLLRYLSRWGNEVSRGKVDISIVEPARHCGKYICPCQYIERHLSCKPRDYPCSCCGYLTDPRFQYQYY